MRRVFIIAEAGVNHNGDLALAEKMVDAAASAGADCIKFQTYRAEQVISRFAPKVEYQMRTTGANQSQLEMVKKYELDEVAHRSLIDRCRAKKIAFLSTPADLGSIDLLEKLGLDMLKIPSGDLTNLPYLRKIGRLNKRLLLSTGMSELAEIGQALDILAAAGTELARITVLHCNTEYPTPMEDVNLRAMSSIGREFNVEVGYSDHTLGIEVPVAAVALGAVAIEKHFTLDRRMEGPDHKASLEPAELRAMVEAVRNVEKALGDGVKRPSGSEKKNRNIARKSIVAARNIKQGELFTEENLAVKRPGTGISPMHWDEMIGRTAGRDFDHDELIVVNKEQGAI